MRIPDKLQRGDGVRVLTPARTIKLPFITQAAIDIALKRFDSMGLKVSFGKHIEETNHFSSSSVESRISDLHDAFEDPSVKLILTVIGGYNSAEMLDYIDYKLIKKNPKALCGYSDITAILNGIHRKTDIVTYYGLHFFDFGELEGFDYSLDYFKKCIFDRPPFEVRPSEKWSNDKWANCQNDREFIENTGFSIINEGQVEGTILGGNLVTFCGISGTPYSPKFKNTILFLEEDEEEHLLSFVRNLTSLTSRKDFSEVKAIVFGRFQPESKITKTDILEVVKNNEKLQGMPMIMGVDFGHTSPRITIPIGGTCNLEATKNPKLRILAH